MKPGEQLRASRFGRERPFVCEDPGWVAPEWVYQVTLMSPYIAVLLAWSGAGLRGQAFRMSVEAL